nr:MAG TPA: minor capsid protein [Caudoviricetes sp.]
MAKLTPEEILRLSEPIEQVYSNVVDALLINMARHFNSGASLSTQEWEMRKLSELNQLSAESINIIANLTGQAPDMVRIALENVALKATEDIEADLKEGVKKGKIKASAGENALASASVKEALYAYQTQAKEKMNLVNTTMLASTLDQFRKIITNTVNIAQSLEATQQALNTAAGKVITGVQSRTQALREALSQVHKEGISGFYDRAGRKWTPEAYINMDIRTTAHNTAIEAVKLRQQDYGVEIFRVSRHSGARPLCYPYQGKYFSWDNSSGTFTDGEGKRHRYRPISSTSYGKAAGLFGVNCGHHPITVIPGVSIPRDREPENKAENDRIYQESQEQRRLERDIRYAKQKAAMLEAAGDKEGFEAEALKIKNAQAKYSAFCKETGRTKRLDRTQVYDYNRSVSSKATAAAKRRDKLETALRNAPVKLPDNTLSKITEGAKITNVETFAGKGSNKELRVKDFLVQNYGGQANEWQHSKARTYVDTAEGPRKAVIHWFYEQSIGVKEAFVKGWSKK